jgi:SAM-dependent methyltransferase
MTEYIGNELELFQFATNWKNYFSKILTPYIKGNVLEVGAGYGVNTKYLYTHECIKWTFIEPDSNLASRIEEFTSDLILPKKIIIGTIDNISNELFDTIIYIDVLEHIEKSENEIDKIKSNLKPGGHLIILVPAFQFLFNDFDIRIGHFRRYNKRILRNEIRGKLLEKNMFYLDSCGLLASIANKLFLKQSEINLKQVKIWDKVMIPFSKIFDYLVLRKFGKSLIGIFQKPY